MRTFDDHLEELLATAFAARRNYAIWWLYKRDRPRYVDTMNHYLGFFEVSIHAHFVAMLMALYKLGDPRSDSASLRTLLAEAKSDTEFAADILVSSEAKLEDLQETWQKVRTLRHKLFAHRDRHRNYEEIFSSVRLTGDQLKDLVDGFIELLNQILYYRQRTTWPVDDRAERDAREMLEDLRNLLQLGKSTRRSLKSSSGEGIET